MAGTSSTQEQTVIQQENMDPWLYKAAREGDVALLKSILEGASPPDPILSRTPQKNTALHIAVRFGHENIVKETQMIRNCASLISKTNFKGDTPLHMAARVGHLRITQLLTPTLEEGTSWGNGATATEVWKMKNLEGNTALHEALKKGHEEVALHLLRFEKRLGHEVNNAKESPLYLAAEAGLLEVVIEILYGGEFSTEGPDGQNPLHIAVIKGRLGAVEILLDHPPHSNKNNFIQMVDNFGKTALHYASTIGYYGDGHSEVHTRTKILARLLKANPSLAYVPDKNGDYPLLIATIKAPFKAVRTILEHCPDSAELINKEGQNALHLAVKKKSEAILQYLITWPEFKKMINEPDEEGNTPMHLATKTNSKEIVELLFQCEGVDLAVTNKNGLTALDMCGDTKEQQMIRDALRKLGAVPSRDKWQELLFLPFHSPPPPLVAPRAPIPTLLVSVESNVKSAAQSLPIVTSLIATVTFAAAFTVPGGYRNNGPDEGMPAFIRKASLQAFVLLNSLAFCCSMVATVLLVYANTYPEDNFLISYVLKTSAWISLVAVVATVSAFMTAVYALTSKECLWVAILSLFLGCTVPIILLIYPNLVELRRDAVRKQRNEYLSTSSRKVVEKLPLELRLLLSHIKFGKKVMPC